MPLDVVQQKNLTEIIDYALEYPSMVLSATNTQMAPVSLVDFTYGLYVGYIAGVFFERFLEQNKRFLDEDELSDFYSVISSRNSEIILKIKTHLKSK